MSNAHTPGPWVLEIRKGLGDASREFTVAEIWASGPYRGCISYMQSAEHIDGIGKEELVANARLIAAAPDMLAALILAEIAADPTATVDERAKAKSAIRAAIAKAEGLS
jgi:hypothetical protein